MKKPLEAEFKYYINNQKELVKRYKGLFIVIKRNKILGSYATELEAIEETAKKEELGTFLVQKCTPGSESYAQMFHTRVTFV